MTTPVPVALFAYRRPDLLARTLESLRANEVPLIYAFSDAAREPADAPLVEGVRTLLRGVTWTRVELVEREVNLGLGTSIVSGTTHVLANHDAVIVCEDDLRVAPGAYAWIVACLRHYESDTRVMSVGGWTHPRVTPRDVVDQPYFSARLNTLFWGTWRRAWSGMAEGSAGERLAAYRAAGGDPGRYGDDLLRQAAVERERNIWAVRFIAHHFVRGGLSVCPPWTLVDHIGYDPRASNAVHDPTWYQDDARPAPAPPATWPEPREHPAIAALWRAGVRAEERAARPPALWRRALRKALRLLRGS